MDLYLYDKDPDSNGEPVLKESSYNTGSTDESIEFICTDDGVYYIVAKWRSGSGQAEVTVENDPPVAYDDFYGVVEDGVLFVPEPGVLGNDTDADGDSLTAIKVSDPSNGVLTLNSNGSFVYTPNPDYSGSDSFTYKANDSMSDSNIATVYITITAENNPPVANFTYSPSSPTDLDVIQFTDTSTDFDGYIDLWYWEFGDEDASTLQNPTHQYTDDGTYLVNLTVTDDDSASDSIQKTIVIGNVPPTAYIDSITPNPAEEGESVSFVGHGTDADGTVTAYDWESSIDGHLSSSISFTDSILSVGTHIISFKVQDDDLEWSSVVTDTLVINPENIPPEANFSWSTDDLEVNFTDESIDTDGYTDSWSWDFGDGNTSTSQNPTHQYSATGNYTVILNVTDDDGAYDSISKIITIRDNTPPFILETYPLNNSVNVSRPIYEFNVTVSDLDGDNMSIYIRWINHTPIEDKWDNLTEWIDVSNGIYSFTPPNSNDWKWGNTTYTWSVNVTDGITWTNKTYHYTTGGSRYDVSNNDLVNFQDAGLVWIHRTSEVDYDGIYDVNQNGVVNFQDAGLTWVNRD